MWSEESSFIWYISQGLTLMIIVTYIQLKVLHIPYERSKPHMKDLTFRLKMYCMCRHM